MAFRKFLQIVERRGPSREVVLALLDNEANKAFFSDRDRVEALATALTIPTRTVTVQQDEEHQAFALAIEDRVTGYPRQHRIDQDFVTTGEFRTLASSYISFDTLAQRLRELAFLNGGVTITIDDERDGKSHKFLYEGGIREFVEFLNQNQTAVNDKPIYMHGEKDGIDVEIALQWNDGYAETVYTFANNINTHEGGTHLSGFRSALTQDDQLLRGEEQPREGPEGREHRRRRHPRRADRGRQREDPAAAVRRPDEDQARQHRGQGHRRGDRQRQAGRVPRAEPGGREEDRRQGRRRGARARGGAQGARPGPPQGRPRQQQPARQARRLPGARSRAERDLHRRRRVGRRVGEAGPRPALPGDPADQGEDPQRREGALRQDARERRDQDDDRGARLRHRPRGVRRRQDPVSPHHHHDRRRRRRLAHPHAAADVLLPADAAAASSAATSTSRSRRCSAPSAAAARCSSATSARSRRG